MKAPLATKFFFFIIACLLVSYSVFQYKKEVKEEEKKQEQALLFKNQIDQTQVKTFSLKRDKEQALVFNLQNQNWNITSPIIDKGDHTKIANLLIDILEEKGELIDTNPLDWSEYGLNPPFYTLNIQAGQKDWNVGMSLEPNFNDQYFIKIANELYLGSNNWKQHTSLWTNDYRSKKLYSTSLLRPSYFSFNTKDKKFKFAYNKELGWEWKSKKIYPLSTRAIENYQKSLIKDMIKDFTKKQVISMKKKKKWLAPDLALEMRLEHASSDEEISSKKKETGLWWLKMNKKGEDRAEVMVSDRDYIYEIEWTAGLELINTNFRDNKAPFKWNLRELGEVKIQANDVNIWMKKRVTAKEGQKQGLAWWDILQPKEAELDQKKWNRFLDWIGSLEATGYYKKKLKQSRDKIVLKNKDGKILLHLKLGSSFEKGGQKGIYVQISKSKETLSIDSQLYKKAVSPSMIKKMKEEAALNKILKD